MQALNEISPLNGNRFCGPAAGSFLSQSCLCALIFLLLSHSVVDAQGDKDPPLNQRLAVEQIHYGDIVEVDVVGSLDFDWRGGLNPEGFLDGLEKVEAPVYALCRTGDEVAATIAERYRRILRDPNVVVRIIDRSNRALAYVSGAVKSPQRFQLRRPVTLTELIVLSGGITDASNGEISVFRPPYVNCRPGSSPEPSFENAATQTPKRFSIKIADLLNGTGAADLTILSGDIVSVLEAPPVFVMLDNGRPRRMNLTPEMTFGRALTSAGGVLKELAGQKVRIYRRNAASEPIEIEIPRTLSSKDETPKLEPYDVIVVQRKGGKTGSIAGLGLPDLPEAGKLAKLPLRIVD
jgi:protein involved in polysaccharide export with SLBB domain